MSVNLSFRRSLPWSAWLRRRRLRLVEVPGDGPTTDLDGINMTWTEHARLQSAAAASIAISQADLRESGRLAEKLQRDRPRLRRSFLEQDRIDREATSVAAQKDILDASFAEQGELTRRGRLAPRWLKYGLLILIGVIEVLAIRTPLLIAYDLDPTTLLGQIETWLVPFLSMGVVLAAAEFAERRKHLEDTSDLSSDNPERQHAELRARSSWTWLGLAVGLLLASSGLRLGTSRNLALAGWPSILAALIPLSGLLFAVAVEYRLANYLLDRRDGLEREERRLRSQARRPLKVEGRYRQKWQRLVNTHLANLRAVDFQFAHAQCEISGARGARPDVFGLAATNLPDITAVTDVAVLTNRDITEMWQDYTRLDPDVIRGALDSREGPTDAESVSEEKAIDAGPAEGATDHNQFEEHVATGPPSTDSPHLVSGSFNGRGSA
jgi:hypothetical protein